jgi:hypothetical protein
MSNVNYIDKSIVEVLGLLIKKLDEKLEAKIE